MSDLCAVDHRLEQWVEKPRTTGWYLRDSESRKNALRERDLTENDIKSPVICFEAWSVLPQPIEPEFAYHAARWTTETAQISSIRQAIEHPSYKRIMAMAAKDSDHVLSLILRELQVRPNHWFRALMTITGENPVKPRDAGRFDRMVDAWLNWGRKRHLLK